ncbi:DUF1186 domain-containing protein [Shewanella sp. VB17]|uniref:DUF1186 domain-containing protein n=1 Tax=Shewanella sp. VB17 TaxID=2739432 RepID=UPI001566331A|nr:DUF1186 domain-containing protein [Shewanella sp. VB17]NRD71793.1 DUF1186 domain-containing protein [Shewanella sp. VB17]
MNLDEIITCFSNELTELPVEALLSARELWPELLPIIDELMQRFIVEEHLDYSELNLLFFSITMIIDRKQFDRFDSLINLTNRGDWPLRDLFGDFISMGLPTAYYILAQGKPDKLCGIVHSHEAGDFIKMAAIGTLFAQLDTEQITHETLNGFFPEFIKNLVNNHQSSALLYLANELISYQFDQYRPQFTDLINQGVMDNGPIENQPILDWDNGCIGDSDWEKGFVSGDFDVIDFYAQWSDFSPEDNISDEDIADEELENILKNMMYSNNELGGMDIDSYALQQPYVAEIKVGRNDPCPCDSGKKFKKCCLV